MFSLSLHVRIVVRVEVIHIVNIVYQPSNRCYCSTAIFASHLMNFMCSRECVAVSSTLYVSCVWLECTIIVRQMCADWSANIDSKCAFLNRGNSILCTHFCVSTHVQQVLALHMQSFLQKSENHSIYEKHIFPSSLNCCHLSCTYHSPVHASGSIMIANSIHQLTVWLVA